MSYHLLIKDLERRLKRYFDGCADKELGAALLSLLDDIYIDVITGYYRDRLTICEIAKEIGCTSRTVVRNKKRLLEEIIERL